MVKHSTRLLLALTGLALFGAAFFFWYIKLDQGAVEKIAVPIIYSGIGDEPITPIPLDMNLDVSKVALGKRLFHDPRLSHDNKTSCALCHNLATGGVDGLRYSTGLDERMGKINTPTVFNSAFNFRLFWDGRAATLEEQIDFQLLNACVMGSTWPEVIAKLEKDDLYRSDFAEIYEEGIAPWTVRDTIATFERSLATPNSKFDRYLRGDKTAMDGLELAGYDLFKSLGCISCHQGRNVGGNMYERLGLVEDYFAQRGDVREADYGRYNVTKIEADRFEFRVPSLRNVALTAPYFHDGSAITLDAAVIIMGKYQLGVDLRGDEVTKIVKFLNTLTGEYDGKPLSGDPQGEVLR